MCSRGVSIKIEHIFNLGKIMGKHSTQKKNLNKKGKKKQKWYQKASARELCVMALAVAILVLCSWLAVLIGDVPFTLQTLGVCLVAGLLGREKGAIAVGAYVLLGFVGVPVFAGFTGGVAKLLSPTGGYILGFLFATPVIGWGSDKYAHRDDAKGVWALASCMLLGLLLCYGVGTVWFVFLTLPMAEVSSWVSAVLICVVPYLAFDFIKIAIAIFMTKKLKRFVPL